MAFLIGLLTLVMVLDCLLLILLVLIQLPKKEAGAGLAFGGGATDALFGAGSGTVLTKITKYAAAVFFAMAVVLSVLQSNYHRRTATEFEKNIQNEQTTLPTTVPPVTPAQTKNITTNATLTVPPTAEAASTVVTAAPTVPPATNLSIAPTNAPK